MTFLAASYAIHALTLMAIVYAIMEEVSTGTRIAIAFIVGLLWPVFIVRFIKEAREWTL